MSSITLNSITPEKSRTLEVIAPGENTIIIRRIMESIKNAGFKILQDEKRTMSGDKGSISHFVSGYKYKTGWIEISSTIQSQTGNTCKVVSTIGIKPYRRKQIKSEEEYREKMFEYIRDGLMGKESVDPYIKADQQMFVVKVYGWMVLALCLSGLTALWAGSSEQIMRIIVLNKVLFYSILGAQLLLVVGLAFFINDIPPPGIALLFIIYSILTGLSLSIIFMLYTKESIVMTFFISAGIFAVMSIYGFFTKTDLTKLGNVLFLSLIDILIASFINFFMNSSTLDWIISLATVIIFCGYIAYDTQMLKYKSVLKPDEIFGHSTKTAISGALSLYLNFLNLFLSLLELLGKESD